MNVVKAVYAWAGRMAFRLGLPYWRYYLRQSQRAYVLLTNDDEILSIKSWLNNGVWHLPGGGMHKDESPELAVQREVMEEIGIDISDIKLTPVARGIWQTNRLASEYQILAGKLTKRPALKLKRPEILEARWMKPGEFTLSNTPPEILEAITSL